MRLSVGSLTIDMEKRLVSRDGAPLRLTPKEYDLLRSWRAMRDGSSRTGKYCLLYGARLTRTTLSTCEFLSVSSEPKSNPIRVPPR